MSSSPPFHSSPRGKDTVTNGIAALHSDTSRLLAFDIAINRVETTILTPCGDVLVCRDRDSLFVEMERQSVWVQNENDGDDGIPSLPLVDHNFCSQICSPYTNDVTSNEEVPYSLNDRKQGLLGGNPSESHMTNGGTDPEGSSHQPEAVKENNTYDSLQAPPSFDYSNYETTAPLDKMRKPLTEVPENGEHNPSSPTASSAQASGLTKLFGSLLLSNESGQNADSVVVIQPKPVTPDNLRPPMVMHGVPTCLPGLTDIRISQVSANPLGSHVLLISYESLLFSYGLNDCGQLGIGTPETFVRNPTLVTAVLEGGGKTIACAGGTNYSLIVVKTSEQRVQTLRENQEHNLIDVQRVTSSSTARHPTSSFEMLRATSSPSRIDVKKSQDDPTVEHVEPSGEVIMDHHQVYGFGANDYFKLGLVNPPTDEKTILSLPHRVALHAKVWSGDDSTSDFPSAGVFGVAASVTHSAALVRRATGAIELYTWGQAQYGALGQSEEARVVSLPTRVAELSYTQSSNDATDVDSITYLRENEYPINVNLGPGCTFVTTNTGRCLSFGTNEDGLLGLGRNFEPEPTQLKFSDSDEYVASISVGARHAVATTAGGRVYTWGQDPASKRMLSRPEPLLSLNSVKAFAGYDLSAFVASSGLVQTCGTKSGRLGQGEVPPNPRVPTPLFGGLRLWQDEECPYA